MHSRKNPYFFSIAFSSAVPNALTSLGGVADEVAGRDEGRDVGGAEVGGELAQLSHRQLRTADVHGTQQDDDGAGCMLPAGHGSQHAGCVRVGARHHDGRPVRESRSMEDMSAENLREIAAGMRTSSRALATVALRRELAGDGGPAGPEGDQWRDGLPTPSEDGTGAPHRTTTRVSRCRRRSDRAGRAGPPDGRPGRCRWGFLRGSRSVSSRAAPARRCRHVRRYRSPRRGDQPSGRERRLRRRHSSQTWICSTRIDGSSGPRSFASPMARRNPRAKPGWRRSTLSSGVMVCCRWRSDPAAEGPSIG